MGYTRLDHTNPLIAGFLIGQRLVAGVLVTLAAGFLGIALITLPVVITTVL